jgi:RHS repeat-associated protein
VFDVSIKPGAGQAFYDGSLEGPQPGQLYASAQHPAALLSSITQPAGDLSAQVSYDPVSGAVSQVTDNNGGVWKIAKPTVAGSSQVYRSAVLGSAPLAYYRLGEAAGAANATSEVRYTPAQYSAVGLGAAGPFTDAAGASFNGTSSYVQLPKDAVSSSSAEQSAEVWFSTTTGGGILVGANANQLGPCNGTACTPILWVGTDGKLYGNFYTTGGAPQLVSSGTVTDGKWHHAVVSASASSQSLYLDGKVAQTKSTSPLAMTGYNYAYVGAGTPGIGWNGLPSSNPVYFKGSLSDASFYRSALSSATVTQHFQAAKNSLGLLPVSTVAVTDPAGKNSSDQYDLTHGSRRVASTDALGHTTSYGYDTSGFLNTVTDPNGNATTTGHDVRGNTVSQTICQNRVTQACSTAYYTYFPDDTTAQLTSSDPRNDVMLTTRDGRSASATDPTYLTSFGYDAKGNKTTVTTPPVPGFPNGRTTTITYSDGGSGFPAADSGTVPAGLPVRTVSPGGAVNTMSYLHDGDVAGTTNADGLVSKISYDGLGRASSQTVVSDTFPNGLTTTFGYDAHNQVLTRTDPVTTDRVTGARHTPVTTSVYDPDGHLKSQTVADATGGDASRTVSSTYNTVGQKDSSTDASGFTTTFGYDHYGNKNTQVDPTGTETDWSYDPAGRLLTQSIQYTGSPLNPQPVRTLTEQSRSYDPAGRLASVTDSLGNTTTYTYFDNGLTATITKTDAQGKNPFVVESDSYDGAGNLATKVTNNGATTTKSTVDAAGRDLASVVDPNGVNRITSVSYTPDDKPATITQTDSTGFDRTVNAAYDPMGNLTSQSLYGDSSGHPVGWWPLNQTSGTTAADASGSGNTASVSNVTWTDGAASFNGQNSQIDTNGPALNTAASYSVSTWVYLTKNSGDYTAIAQGGNGDASFYLQYAQRYNAWAFVSPVIESPTPGTFQAAHDSQPPTLNKWTHLVVTFNAATSTMSLYVDNRLAGTATNTTPWSGKGSLVMGAVHNTDGNQNNFFPGEIGNVQVYQRALSAADVQTLFTASRSGGTVASSQATTVTRTLDKRGLPIAQKDANGNTTSYSYDEAGHLAVTTAPVVSAEVAGGAPTQVHPVNSTGYDTFGEAVEQQDPDGNVTTTGYDANGRVASVTHPNYTPPGSSTPITAVTVNGYDRLGNLTSVTDPLNHVTKYVYDQLGDRVRTTQPDGSNADIVYDTNGDKLQTTDPTGAQTQATYDLMGRQLTATALERYPTPVSATTINSYAPSVTNPGGAFLASTTTAAGVVTSYGYDNLGEPTSVIDGAGNKTTAGYDFVGHKRSTTLPDGSATTAIFDAAGNPTSTTLTDPTGKVLATTSASFDGNGNQLTSTDARGTTSRHTYDATGMVIQEVQPVTATSSITTTFGYDAAGNRSRFTDGRGNSWITTYNSWNKPESVLEPATATYTADADRRGIISYDPDGRVASQTAPGGASVVDGYDVNGNLATQTASGADAPTAARTIGYDHDNRPISAKTDAIGTTTPATNETFTYNDRGNVLTTTGSAGSSTLGYTIDDLPGSRADAAGTTTYTYDSADRLGTLTDAATNTKLTYGYNNLDQVAQISYGTNQNVRTYSYDAFHRLASDTLSTSAHAVVASIGYDYDLDGNLKTKTTTGFANSATNTYTYDLANRLSTWTAGANTTNYSYDNSGNRTQVGANVYTYDARDELTSDGQTSYSYTARGTLSKQGNTVVSFDAFGQMATHGTQHYTYDALGRTLSSGSDTFSFAATSTSPSSDGHNTYTYDPAGTLTGIGSGTPGTGVLAWADQHNDVVGQFSATSTALSGSASYDPLGNKQSGATVAGKLGFQSGWTDPATSKVSMGSRWYDPAAGQFASTDTAPPDPAHSPTSANPFSYVDGNPLTRMDPSGHGWFDDFTSSISDAWDSFTSTVSDVWDDVSSAIDDAWDWVDDEIIEPCVHYVDDWVDTIEDDWSYTSDWIDDTASYIATTVSDDASSALDTAGDLVSNAVDKAVTFAENHVDTVVSFAAGAVAFAGCTALTAGVGVIGCAALAGAAANAVSYGMDCGSQVGGCSGGGLLAAMGLGALGGALGGALAGPLGGKLVSSFLDGVLPDIAVNALVGAYAGGGVGVVEYGLTCGSSRDGCSVGGAFDAALDGAAAGAFFGGLFGGSGKSEPGEPPAVGETPATADAADAAAGHAASAQEPAAAPAEEPAAAKEDPAEDESSCPTQPAGGEVAHSFVGGTPVLMADGSTKPISQVKVGDQVSDSVPGDSTIQSHPVQAVITTTTDHDFVDVSVKSSTLGQTLAAVALAAATLTTTFHHPFYDVTQSAFVDAVDLKPGDQIQTTNGGTATVTERFSSCADFVVL